MISIFKLAKIKRPTEIEVKSEILRRAEINQVARNMAFQLRLNENRRQLVKPQQYKTEMISLLDSILDNVQKFDNIKISTICELYNAIENNDTKNLITFLKKKEKIPTKKKKETWEL